MANDNGDFGQVMGQRRNQYRGTIADAIEDVRERLAELPEDVGEADPRIGREREPVEDVTVERAVVTLIEKEVIGAGDIEAFRGAIESDCDLLLPAVGAIGETAHRDEAIVAATGAAGDMLAEVDHLLSLLPDDPGSRVQSAVSTLKGWLGRLKSTIKNKISQKLWNLISSLQNPDSWTVTGDAGVNLLGLSGNVGIEVTFT